MTGAGGGGVGQQYHTVAWLRERVALVEGERQAVPTRQPLALHDEVAGLLDAGVMLHGKPQRRRKRLLLMGRGRLQGRHDQPREPIGGREVLGLPRLRVGAGKVEHADGAMALTHRNAQPRPDARRQRQGAEVGPA
jgi:hypothetical protein